MQRPRLKSLLLAMIVLLIAVSIVFVLYKRFGSNVPETDPNIWEVMSIEYSLIGSWSGRGDDGSRTGGFLMGYIATCSNGRKEREFVWSQEPFYPEPLPEIPLQKGDKFRIVLTDGQIPLESIKLPDGTRIIKTN